MVQIQDTSDFEGLLRHLAWAEHFVANQAVAVKEWLQVKKKLSINNQCCLALTNAALPILM